MLASYRSCIRVRMHELKWASPNLLNVQYNCRDIITGTCTGIDYNYAAICNIPTPAHMGSIYACMDALLDR